MDPISMAVGVGLYFIIGIGVGQWMYTRTSEPSPFEDISDEGEGARDTIRGVSDNYLDDVKTIFGKSYRKRRD